MDLDAALRLLGNVGRYQKLQYCFLAYTYFLGPFVLLSMVFIGTSPKRFYCEPPPGFEANQTVPGYGEPEEESCRMYEVHDGIVTNDTIKCQYGWVYETEYGETTIVKDFNLVCDDAVWVKVAQSMLMCGVLVGSVTSGQIADHIGRKTVLFVSILGDGICAMASAWVGNFYAFLFFYFWLGVFEQGVLNSTIVMISEMFAPEIRTYAVSGTAIIWGFSASMVAPIAYLLPDWRHFQVFTSCIHLAIVPLWLIFPESTRWLISRGRMKEAEENLHNIARVNGVDHPGCFLTTETSEAFIINDGNKNGMVQTADVCVGDDINGNSKTVKRYYLTDIFKSRVLLRSFLILAFCWFTNSIFYYGLAINSALIKGNRYLNVFLGCFVELPSGILMVFCLKWIGRRPALSAAFFLGGACCIVVAFLPETTDSDTNLYAAIVAIASFGKFWASFSFSMGYVFSPEIMPTVIRQVSLGGCSFFSRIGGILSPFIIYLGDIHPYIPLNIIGVFVFAAGFLCLILPETRNQPLPDTIEEGEEQCRKVHMFSNIRRNRLV